MPATGDDAARLPPALIDARLRALASLSAQAGPAPPLVDMSAAAMTARLRDCAEISALALDLLAAGELRFGNEP